MNCLICDTLSSHMGQFWDIEIYTSLIHLTDDVQISISKQIDPCDCLLFVFVVQGHINDTVHYRKWIKRWCIDKLLIWQNTSVSFNVCTISSQLQVLLRDFRCKDISAVGKDSWCIIRCMIDFFLIQNRELWS